MEGDIADDSNDARAEASVVWLLGWALVLPFAHPLRLFAYGLVPAAILTALTILFPGASIFAPTLVTPDFALHMSAMVLPIVSVLIWVLLLFTFVLSAFLLCIWQRDIVHRFRDPLIKLTVESMGRLAEYLVMMLILVILLAIAFASSGMIPVTVNDEPILNGPLGWPAALVAIGFYARLSLVGPLIAAGGLRGAFGHAWRLGKRRAVGQALVFVVIGLIWVGLITMSTVLGLLIGDSHGLLIASAGNIAATLVVLLWLTAVPALIVRRLLDREAPETTAFD